MKVGDYLKSPAGQISVFVVIFAMIAFFVWTNVARQKKVDTEYTAAVVKKDETAPAGPETIKRQGSKFVIPEVKVDETEARKKEELEREKQRKKQQEKEKEEDDDVIVEVAHDNKGVILPISIYNADNASTQDKMITPSSRYAPYGRLLQCETVITIDSAKAATPIIGIVTEDLWHEGKCIIPAGAEVHGSASTDRVRERIMADGPWVIVWRIPGEENGMELVVQGIALNQEVNLVTGNWGLLDGTAGLAGDILKTDKWEEIKLFASTFLSGLATGLQDTQQTVNGLTGAVTNIPTDSTKNAILEGTSEVLNLYAQRILDAMEKDGFFVRVPSGKQFYLYIIQTIDDERASIGNANAKDVWAYRTEQEKEKQQNEREKRQPFKLF